MGLKELLFWWVDFSEKNTQETNKVVKEEKIIIDKNAFLHNLRPTQEYCRLQMKKESTDNARVFRSINPVVKDEPLFSFKEEYYDFEIVPDVNTCVLVNWKVDPFAQENQGLITQLFEQQKAIKSPIFLRGNESYEGDIFVSQVGCSVLDGASEVVALGLIDIYDLPPIDTWFYMSSNKEGMLLFAWIPKEFRHYANEAILVNFLDCIGWFEERYPNEYKRLHS